MVVVNEGSQLTIVNVGLSLTIVNKTTNLIKTVVFKNYRFLKTISIENDCFGFSFFPRRFHDETIVF